MPVDACDDARRWLTYATEDMDAARGALNTDSFVPRQVCWLAQQAVEKAIKAALIYLQLDFPYRHDLDALRGLLPPDWGLHADCPDLAELTEWAVEARYPGDWPDATRTDAERALQQAEAVLHSVIRDLTARSDRLRGL